MTDLPLSEEERSQILLRLQALEIEHHDLDDVIDRLALDPGRIACSSSASRSASSCSRTRSPACAPGSSPTSSRDRRFQDRVIAAFTIA